MTIYGDWNELGLSELFERLIDDRQLMGLIDAARSEDLGSRGDITTQLLVPEENTGAGQFRARRPGRLAGAKLLPLIAKRYDQRLEVDLKMADGEELSAGDVVAEVRGPFGSMLSAERVMLNFLTHLSGIASLTNQYVEAVAGTKAKIYDTRKTIPGMRGLAKWAVRCGGGSCHRIGLFDAVLVKDNHLAALAGATLAEKINEAVARARQLEPRPAFFEVEVDDMDQLRHVLNSEVDIVLLDNMTPLQLAEAVKTRDLMRPEVELEASGGVDLTGVRQIAEAGVDRIAIGALTHSAPTLDLGLDIA